MPPSDVTGTTPGCDWDVTGRFQNGQPHNLPATVAFIQEGVKKLRAVPLQSPRTVD